MRRSLILPIALAATLVAGLPATAGPPKAATTAVAAAPAAAALPSVGLAPNGAPRTIPGLQNWTTATGTFAFDADSTFVTDDSAARGIADEAADDLGDILDTDVPGGTGAPEPGDALLTLDASRSDLGKEGYAISVGASISITAATVQGLFYGTRTVLQWATLAKTTRSVPAGSSIDIPQYAERGAGICACQIQVSVEYLQRLIKELSYYKMNQLWMETKIASAGYPAANFWAYFTPAQARSISDYAAAHHVELVLEVNSPGHMEPWLANYPELQLTNDAGQRQPGRLDITKPEALQMITSLFDEYRASTDSPYWHMGADEYMLGSDYAQYPQIEAYARQKFGPTATATDAFIDFINQVNAYVKSKGKQLRIWNDGIPATPGLVALDRDIIVEHWTGSGPSPAQLLQDGHDVMNSSYDLYLIRGAGSANARSLWDTNWTVRTFSGNIVVAPDAGPGTVTGAKLTVWPDNGAGDTELSMEAKVHPVLRFLAQATWNSPRPTTTYDDFAALGAALGNGPRWQNVDQLPLAGGSYRIGVGDTTLNVPASASDPVRLATTSTPNSWTLSPTSDGYYTISSNGRCLDVVGTGTKLWLGVPVTEGIQPQATTCTAGRNLQKWWIRATSGGFELVNAIVQMPLTTSTTDIGAISQQPMDVQAPAVFQFAADTLTVSTPVLARAVAGLPVEVPVTVTNISSGPVTDVSASLQVPAGWTVTGSPADIGTLTAGQAATVVFRVTPGSDAGSNTLALRASGTVGGEVRTVAAVIDLAVSCATESTRPESVVRVDSQETNEEFTPAPNAIDGNPNTFWGTQWSGTDVPNPPHTIVVDLGAEKSVCALNVLPRQGTTSGAANGQIAGYEVYTTSDAAVAAGTDLSAWGTPVATGRFPAGFQQNFAPFVRTTTARYVMLRALSEQRGDPWTTVAELSVDVALGADTTPPVTSATIAPTAPDGTNGWWRSPVTVSLTATDDRGVAGIEYRIGSGSWQAYSRPVTISQEGTSTLSYRATDQAENTSATKSVTVKIDRTAPRLTATTSGTGPVRISAAATDSGSGVATVQYRIGAGAFVTTRGQVNVARTGAAQSVEFRATDRAGNTSTARVVVPAKIRSSVALSASTTRQSFGTSRPVVLRAAVTVAGQRNPVGTVRFVEGTRVLGTATLTNGRASIVLRSTTAVGGHRITAVFVPSNQGSTSGSTSRPVLVTVLRARSTTTLRVTPKPGDAPTAVIARVALDTARPAVGVVEVRFDGKRLRSVAVRAGVAGFTLPATRTSGRHVVAVTFVPASRATVSPSSAFQVVRG